MTRVQDCRLNQAWTWPQRQILRSHNSCWLAIATGVRARLPAPLWVSTTSQPGWKHARWFGAYIANSAVMIPRTRHGRLDFVTPRRVW